MSTPFKVMMLTAGLGTRLRPVTDSYAKPAVPFLGIPLLYYPLALAREAGMTELVLNAHYKPEQIEALAGEIRRSGLKVNVSHEPGAPLGSGGGIKKAQTFLASESSDFLVMNGDEVILPRRKDAMKRFVEGHRASGALATLMVMRHPLVGTQFGGVWTDAQGAVRGFGKNGSAFGSGVLGYHYVGLLMLNPRVFSYLREGESNILYDALAEAIAAGESVRAHVDELTWFETGNPHDFLEGTREALTLLRSGTGLDAQVLRAITERHWPSRTRLESTAQSTLLQIAGAKVSSEAKLSGFIIADRDCEIESGVVLHDCVLLPGARVVRGQSLTQQIIR